MARHPPLSVRSTRVENPSKREGDRFGVAGESTIRGTTIEVVLECEHLERGTDP